MNADERGLKHRVELMPMRRRIVTAICLFFCFALAIECAMWVRSNSKTDAVNIHWRGHQMRLCSLANWITFDNAPEKRAWLAQLMAAEKGLDIHTEAQREQRLLGLPELRRQSLELDKAEQEAKLELQITQRLIATQPPTIEYRIAYWSLVAVTALPALFYAGYLLGRRAIMRQSQPGFAVVHAGKDA